MLNLCGAVLEHQEDASLVLTRNEARRLSAVIGMSHVFGLLDQTLMYDRMSDLLSQDKIESIMS